VADDESSSLPHATATRLRAATAAANNFVDFI
jgi:hypothetical protein